MILLLALACSQDPQTSPEVIEAEKRVEETISAISNTISNHESELAALEAELEAIKSQNKPSSPVEKVAFGNCVEACEAWRNGPNNVSSQVQSTFALKDRSLLNACQAKQQPTVTSKNACIIDCRQICNGVDWAAMAEPNSPATP